MSVSIFGVKPSSSSSSSTLTAKAAVSSDPCEEIKTLNTYIVRNLEILKQLEQQQLKDLAIESLKNLKADIEGKPK
jgi:hypothetical protein